MMARIDGTLFPPEQGPAPPFQEVLPPLVWDVSTLRNHKNLGTGRDPFYLDKMQESGIKKMNFFDCNHAFS